MALLDKARVALRVTVNDYDGEISDLIEAAKLDLGIAGVIGTEQCESDALLLRAILTYCRAHFGGLTDGEYDRIKAAYDEQKAQLMTASGYTDFTGEG
jgi:hypothetical protein